MPGKGDCLDAVAHGEERLEAYSGLFHTDADAYRPRDEAELRCIFAFATRESRAVTVRGGAHAFDDQSLGCQIVVSMENFNKIEIGPGAQVTVGAGAPWGKIVRRLKRKGLVPYGTVTSSLATPGGTLAADCLSRFSPSYGKEAEHVLSFRMMRIDGSAQDYSPPPPGNPNPATWTEDQRIFMAVVGGFGYLGALLEITYAVRRCGSSRIAVRTEVDKLDSFEHLVSKLIPETKTARANATARANSDCGGEDWEAISAGLYPAGGDHPSALLFKSKLVKTCWRWPYLLHHPHFPLTILAQWLMRKRRLCRVLSRGFFMFTWSGMKYTDGLQGYLFFMDANLIARNLARTFGIDLHTIQQTFVVPIDLDAPDAHQPLLDWLDRAQKELAARNLTPTITDVLYLPQDWTFCLSPNARRPGFAVSYAFETNDTDPVEDAFRALADILWTDFHGHVSLVKNVRVNPATLHAMYGPQAGEFLTLKHRLDPSDLLRNKFFSRVLDPPPPPAP
ncbi:MAG: FAD-dependent oxidoreductase [Solirubrobacteraceae bacterium]